MTLGLQTAETGGSGSNSAEHRLQAVLPCKGHLDRKIQSQTTFFSLQLNYSTANYLYLQILATDLK